MHDIYIYIWAFSHLHLILDMDAMVCFYTSGHALTEAPIIWAIISMFTWVKKEITCSYPVK